MKTILILGVAMTLASVTTIARAQHDHDDHAGHDHGPPAATMDEAAMMEMWMKAATPGEPHAYLAEMAGDWATTMRSYEMGQLTETTEGTARFESIMGGRVVQGHFTGTMMGMPHQGMSLDGYNNSAKEFWSIWVDNMGTGVVVLRGTMEDDGKTIDHHGTMQTPMGEMKMHFTTTRVSDDEVAMKGYMAMPGMPEEMLMMEIDYKRAAS